MDVERKHIIIEPAPVQSTCIQNKMHIYSSVNQLLANEKYCDVTILIGNQSFRNSCLILAGISEYFDAMFFDSDFSKENSNKKKPIEISLHEIDAMAFEQILQFMQFGEITVTHNNVYSLLTTNDFLGVRTPYIEEQCTLYLQNCVSQTKQIILNAVEILRFAHVRKKTTLVDLMSEHIFEHFKDFSSDENSLNISFDELDLVLRHRRPYGYTINDTKLLNFISRWLNYSRKERKKYRHSLMGYVDMPKVSGQYLTKMIHFYEDFMDQIMINETAKTAKTADDHADHVSKFLNNVDPSTSATSLYLFALNKIPTETRVFSVNDKECVSSVCKIPSQIHFMQTTVVCDTLYCLSDSSSDIHNLNTQTFSASKSVHTIHDIVLDNPPLVLSKFNICGLQNHIYVYNADYRFNSSKSTSTSYVNFSDEERLRGIYVFNCEINKWFPVPPMKDRVFNSSMTIDNDVLYLIGGNQSEGSPYRFMQTYDYRMKTWNKVCIPTGSKSYINSSCCAHRNKIYVSCTSTCNNRQSTDLDVYDPLAGDWSCAWKSIEFLGDGNHPPKLVSHKNELWMISTSGNMNIGVYDTAPKAKRTCNFSLRNLVDKQFLYFLDGVVF